VTLTESTSPSALLGGSLDGARRFAAMQGEERLGRTIAALGRTRERVREIPGLDVLDERLAGRRSVLGWDPLRLSVDVRGTGASGHRISELMRDLDDSVVELASENVVVAVFGMAEDAERTSERLLAALQHAAESVGPAADGESTQFAPPPPWGALEMAPRQAFLSPHEAVPFDHAAGRVAAESLAAYPPGIPNVLPGELLTGETLNYIREALAHGDLVRGPVDRTLKTIRVVVKRR
jgi:lysine decarboxylase